MLNKISLLITIAVFSLMSVSSAATQQQNLPNGIPVVVDAVRMAPYVSMTILIDAGAMDETASTAGWRQLLASAMMRATTNGKDVLQGAQLTQAAEAAGGQIGAQVLDDAIAFTAAGDSSTQKELANLLLNVVLHPRLSEADFAAARRGMLMNLNAADRNDVPDHSRATEALQSLLYRDAKTKTPTSYGLPPEGTVDSLTGLTDGVLSDLYKKFFSSHSMVISYSGDADVTELHEAFSQISDGAPVSGQLVNYVKLTPPPSQTIQMNTPAPWVLVGYRIEQAINLSNHDLAALRVLTAALAETAPSLLSQNLLAPQGKNQSAVADQVSGQFYIRREGSELMVAVQSDAERLAVAKAIVLQVINDLKTKPITDAQLHAAITYAEGDWASTRDTNINRAVLAGYAKVQKNFPDNQWPEQLEAVTIADVQNVANKYLNQYAVVTVDVMNN